MLSSLVLSRASLGRVLVVEEQRGVAETIADLLDAYEVVVAGSAREAYEQLCADAYFDVVVCSEALQDLPAVELIDRVERHRPRYGERFVFTTPGAFGRRDHDRVTERLVERTLVEGAECIDERQSAARGRWS